MAFAISRRYSRSRQLRNGRAFVMQDFLFGSRFVSRERRMNLSDGVILKMRSSQVEER